MQAASRGSAHISHDPFLLNKVARQHRRLHQTLRGESLDQVESEWQPKRSLSLRATAWRILGGLAIVGASWVLVLVTTQPQARRAIVDWVTFGIGSTDRSGEQEGVRK